MLLSKFFPLIQFVSISYSGLREIKHNIHRLIHLINIKLAMDLLHSLTRTFHCSKGLSIDIRRLDRVYLLFQGRYLGSRLLEGMLMLLLSS